MSADEFADLFAAQANRQNGPDPQPSGSVPDWTPGFQHLVLAVLAEQPHLVKFPLKAREMARLFAPSGAQLPRARLARWLGEHYERNPPKGPQHETIIDQVMAERWASLQGVEREEVEADWKDVRAIALPEHDLPFILKRVREGVGRERVSSALLESMQRLSPGDALRDITQALVQDVQSVQSEGTDEGDRGDASYLQPLAEFLAEPDAPMPTVLPELLPRGVLLLLHGDPRSRKSLVAFELALSTATGTAPFGLERFRPSAPTPVIYVQEEDPRELTKVRLLRLVRERCGRHAPDTMLVSIRKGVNLDDPVWVARLIADVQKAGAGLLVLDAARRLSAKTDEGPAKLRELTGVLRSIITATGVAIIVVHHDVKPGREGQDPRRRGQRASGGDWFAASECPVHVERVSALESLVFPQDYKFAADPAPFTFTIRLDGKLIRSLIGKDVTAEGAETVAARTKLIEWLARHGPASKTAMTKAGLGHWSTLEALVRECLGLGEVEELPGRRRDTYLYGAAKKEP